MATKNAVFMRLVAFCKRLMEKDYREEAYNEGTKKQIKGIKKKYN